MKKYSILFTFLSLLLCQSQGFSKERKPNIIIIYTDDLGYGDLSIMNEDSKIPTPNIDRIGNEGVSFTDGHSSDAVCTPSRYSLLTGRYSWRTSLKKGVVGAEGKCLITSDRMTLASLCKQNGYNTAMIGKWHLKIEMQGKKGDRDWSQSIIDGPTNKGFDYFYGIAASMNYGILTYIENDRVTEPASMWTRKKIDSSVYTYGPGYYRMMPPYDKEKLTDKDVEVAPGFIDSDALKIFTNKTIAYIHDVADEAKKGKPFFIYMPLTSSHLPHCPADEFIGKSKVGVYGDFVLETDYRVGQVLEALEKHGLDNNTMVIFTSDNGAEKNYLDNATNYGHLSNYNLKGGKRDIYEGGHRIPFLIKWPGVVKAGSISTQPVCQVDLLGTFADMFSTTLNDNEGEDSHSILPVLLYKKQRIDFPVINHSISGQFAIREGKWKLYMPNEAPKSESEKLKYELYDLDADLQETKNLINDFPEVAQRLKNRMTKIIANGRSTPGQTQKNDYSKVWKGLTWMEYCSIE